MTAAREVDVLILGAGAAGLMCAIAAGRRGRRVLLLDHANEAGKKILISGGGRCNFTNLGCAPDRFFSANPRFATSALARYTPADFLTLVEAHGIAWHEKTLGQLFCDGRASAIVAMLLAECAAANVDVLLSTTVSEMSRADRFRAETSAGTVFAASLVLATGGLSIPKMGATGFSHDIAAQFGLAVVPPRPALVPLVLGGEIERTRPLSGVALPVVARCGRQSFREAMLFTHRGLSGPAILQISSCWREADEIALDLLPDAGADVLAIRKRTRPRALVRSLLAELLPQRVADLMLPDALATAQAGDIPDRTLRALGETLKTWRVAPLGSEGYAKAEVTLGGIATSELSSRTMQARAVPGLFVVGEAVDVTGWLGGYNFQWAWASGWCAGEYA